MKPDTVEAEILSIDKDKQEVVAVQIQRKIQVVGLCVCVAIPPYSESLTIITFLRDVVHNTKAVETEGPWRAFTRFVSNSWNHPLQHRRREESARRGTSESQRTFNWGNWGFTFHSSFQSTWQAPVWEDMEVSEQI